MDFYVRKVTIENLFEQGNNYKIDLSEGCNCIYGTNGTGKTTIINLIVNSLTVDVNAIARCQFCSISIEISKTNQKRPLKFLTISKTKVEETDTIELTFQIHEELDQKITITPNPQNRTYEKNQSTIELIRRIVATKINLTHVPLLRMHDSEIFGIRDERDEFLHRMLHGKHLPTSQINEIIDPSVRVLNTLQRQFLSEANDARKTITNKLEVLKSKIIEKVMIDESLVKMSLRALSKTSTAISSQLEDVDVSAYVEKFSEAKINVPEERIREHFSTWKKLNDNVRDAFNTMDAVRKTKALDPSNEQLNKKEKDAYEKFNNSYFSLFAVTNFNDRFLSIIKDVESMQDEKYELTKFFSDYEIEANKYFNPRKSFKINEDGQFSVKSNDRQVNLYDLSSGEKHILTILGKAALSRREGTVFIADEPELSLHLDWQRIILPSIIKLSPKSQIIVATHSPSINAKGSTEIDLEECRR